MNLEPLNQTNLFELNHYFDELKKLYLEKKLPNKILLSGEKGIGKCTMSYHLINYILSFEENYSYDFNNYKINLENKSFKLVLNKSNPNFHLIDVAEDRKNIDINQIRNLIFNLNKSSFNSNPRFVLIDNIELLNNNSVNALLKILEEPNDNINFILINNNKKILPTLTSRCLNFKISITYNQSIKIVNDILNLNIYDLLNIDLINNYSTPGQLLSIISLGEVNNIDLKNTDLKGFLSIMIKEKYYKKDIRFNDILYSLIEFYFRKNLSKNNIKLMSIKNSFLKKINNMKIFNLDDEAFFIEFHDKVLNG
jgi:DNA polymerase-3 subunit delta'